MAPDAPPVPSPSGAQSAEEPFRATAPRRRSKTREIFRERTQQALAARDFDTVCELSFAYANGDGVKRDLREAVRLWLWLDDYCTEEFMWLPAKVALELGYCFRFGKGGVPIDMQAARRYFCDAANPGDINAIFQLATIQLHAGENEAAYKNLVKCCDAHDKKVLTIGPALYFRGLCEANGIGTAVNLVAGIYWASEAAMYAETTTCFGVATALLKELKARRVHSQTN